MAEGNESGPSFSETASLLDDLLDDEGWLLPAVRERLQGGRACADALPVLGAGWVNWMYFACGLCASAFYAWSTVDPPEFSSELAEQSGLPAWFPHFCNGCGCLYCIMASADLIASRRSLASVPAAMATFGIVERRNSLLASIAQRMRHHFAVSVAVPVCFYSVLSLSVPSGSIMSLMKRQVPVVVIVMAVSPFTQLCYDGLTLLSQSEVDIMRERLDLSAEAAKPAAACSLKPEYWKLMTREHRAMDYGLERLWSAACGGPTVFLALASTGVGFTLTVVVALSSAHRKVFIGLATLGAVFLLIMLMPLWKLAGVTAACQSSWPGSWSICRLALEHCGRADMPADTEP